MSVLRRLANGLAALLLLLAHGVSMLLQFVVGELHWSPPVWLTGILDLSGSVWRGLTTWLRVNPRGGALLFVLLLTAGGGGWYGWHWWQQRPKPVEVTFSVEPPARTCYECDAPDNQPKPLVIRFSASVAPLKNVGKAVDPHRAGLDVSPAIEGVWTWQDDKTLQFQPKADWPIGQRYDLAFARHGFVASHIHLKDYSARFSSAPFIARIDSTEFYQDPVNVTDKKVVVTVSFSHPVSAPDFETRVKLSLFEKVTDQEESKVSDPSFTVQYDKLRLHAYVHSQQLDVPAKQGRIAVAIAPGLRAARGGNEIIDELESDVTVPGQFALRVTDLHLDLARDEHDDPKQILLLHTSYSVTEQEIVPHVKAWLLPEKNPKPELQKKWERDNEGKPYAWTMNELRDDVIQTSQPLPLDYTQNEQEHVEQHSFHYQADPGRQIYVRVDKGMRSFGGYILGDTSTVLLTVPEFPKELRIAHEGSLLAMSGAKKLTVFSRDVPGVRIEIGRLLPDQIQHLVTQTGGSYGKPQFINWNFNEYNLTERFTKDIRLPKLAPGTAHYEGIDLGAYLDKEGADRRGVFLLHVSSHDPDEHKPANTEGDSDDDSGNQSDSGESPGGLTGDTRLIVVTDLGLLVKKAVDGSQDVFVQSIHSGEPMAGVTLEVLGRNGEAILAQTTDNEGHAHFADLKSFKREREPVLYLARKGGDTSFLPIGRSDRQLELSRFDIGGVRNEADSGRLTAYLFSDRGIYRPGDEIRVGAIIKSQDWRKPPAGLPLRVTVTDPRGALVKRDTLRLSPAGFEEIRYTPRDTAPTGEYTISLSIIKSEDGEDAIGSLTVKVQEFQPDRLRMAAHLSSEVANGWVSPEKLKARIDLQNLFGTPAQNRRVTAQMTLSPSFPSFAAYPDYQFHDPQAAKEGFSDTLADGKTDDQGGAEFDLNLQRFARATYRVHFVAEGFEADGGRGVAAEAAQLVSNLPYLVGWKADGDLGYVSRDTQRSASIIAIDPQAKKIDVKDLHLLRIEHRYVSVLTQLDNGTYKYVSKIKDVTLDDQPYAVPAVGSKLGFDTRAPGDYSYVLQDASGQQYARIDYSVAGAANLAGRLDKNAELKLTLDRKDYAPGDDIAMQLTAPYTGAGLITIERDKVYAWKWFKADTTSSVQHIKLPEGLDGNAYVNVTFVRDPGSNEIYSSPLSYGVQPFSIALDRRTAQVTLDKPALVKPGQRLAIRYKTDRPTRIVIFAIDEGILQVARYKTPDALGYFFQKRSLDVSTTQILDLILPEFMHDVQLAAPGGDAEGALGRHLNPFKRKTDKPVAYWSGIIDADSTLREVDYDVPDYFNGTLRVMAVAVADEAIGVAESKTTVRGDFVLSPNAPTTVAPGDEFDVSVGVANNVAGSGADAPVMISVQPSSQLEVEGDQQQGVKITEMHEGVVHFKVKARDDLGSAMLHFHTELNGKSADINATMSVRSATPYYTTLQAGMVAAGHLGSNSVDVPLTRTLYPQYRQQQAGISVLPLSLAHGLTRYLGNYPYDCTEQLSSMAMPAIVLGNRAEFGEVKQQKGADLSGLIDELRSRQDSDGAYRMWPGGGSEVVEFVSLYAQQVLIEAQDRGMAVPRDLINHGNDWLHGIAGRDGNNLGDERDAAYAIYLLTRQGNVMANEAVALQGRLDQRYSGSNAKANGDWHGDVTAAYLASAYQLMKQQRLADKTIAKLKLGATTRYDDYHGPMAADAEVLYLLARHFPDRAKSLPADFLPGFVDHVKNGDYDSLSAAEAILALDQYATTMGPQAAGKLSIAEVLKGGVARALPLPDNVLPEVTFSENATKLRYGNDSDLRAFWLSEQSGFDRQPPATAQADGFEILREYTDTDGKPVSSVKLGQELVVHLKLRATQDAFANGVLVDLLPGGFEIVMPRTDPAQQEHQTASPDNAAGTDSQDSNSEGQAQGEGDDAQPHDCGCGFLWSHPSAFPDYADLREDRVVAYGAITPDVQELTYRIKATNLGRFTVPPAYGEAMYDRKIQARSVAGMITVEKP